MFEFYKRFKFLYWAGWRAVRNHLNIFHCLKAKNIDKIPLKGPVIVASNHISHLDPPAVGASIPRGSSFVAKEELFKTPFLSWYLPAIDALPIRRGGGGGKVLLEKSAEIVKKGGCVVLFPEGTRSRNGYPGKPKTGVLVLAAMTGAPIIPARISGSYDCMPPGALIAIPGKIEVVFGDPIIYEPGELDLNNREQIVEETKKLMETINNLPGWLPRKAGRRKDKTSARTEGTEASS